jgi:TRAP-type C4-dicarboxylate transport system substrate-binding protein
VHISWPGAEAFKLQEVSTYHMDVPFGLFPAFVVMNHGSYARLPDAAKRAFDQNSGEAFSKAYGAGLDKSNGEAIERFKKLKGHEVVELAPAELERWEKVLAPVVAEWVKATPDGAKVLAAFRAEVKKVRSGS